MYERNLKNVVREKRKHSCVKLFHQLFKRGNLIIQPASQLGSNSNKYQGKIKHLAKSQSYIGSKTKYLAKPQCYTGNNADLET